MPTKSKASDQRSERRGRATEDGYQARTVPLDEGLVELPEPQAERVSAGESAVHAEVPMEGPSTAAEVMTESVWTAPPDAVLTAVATIMRDQRVGIVPIVDDDGRLLGVITDRDIVVR